MRKLEFTTVINAPKNIVFDLSRSVNAHLESTSQTHETAIGGKTAGLLDEGDEVIWKGRHFGLWLTHHSRITLMQPPDFFIDEMVSGNFTKFRHMHTFVESDGKTIMHDIIEYDVPLGIIGQIFDKLTLAAHLRILIQKRNTALKSMAESA